MFGITEEFVEDNQSRSSGGALRGLDYRSNAGQAKVVRVSNGRIWDVVVDVRRYRDVAGAYLERGIAWNAPALTAERPIEKPTRFVAR